MHVLFADSLPFQTSSRTNYERTVIINLRGFAGLKVEELDDPNSLLYCSKLQSRDLHVLAT